MKSRRNRSTPSCRLFVLKAAIAPTAVILRRGPSRWYHLIRWDLRRDAFEHGAWFHGRIYEDRCDVSPDGNLFVYAAFKRIRVADDWVYSYTAMSRPPWLFALELRPAPSVYEVGGRFLDDVHCRWYASNPVHQSTEAVADADWSGTDHRGRTIYTVGGKLYRVVKKQPVEIADFNNLKPDPQPAPESARIPIRRGRGSK
jgi:hypothetical protein